MSGVIHEWDAVCMERSAERRIDVASGTEIKNCCRQHDLICYTQCLSRGGRYVDIRAFSLEELV